MIKRLPTFIRGFSKYCIMKMMKAKSFGNKKMVVGKRYKKKMLCKLFGTKVRNNNNNKDDFDFEAAQSFTMMRRDDVYVSQEEFAIPDKIMILIYERGKQ